MKPSIPISPFASRPRPSWFQPAPDYNLFDPKKPYANPLKTRRRPVGRNQPPKLTNQLQKGLISPKLAEQSIHQPSKSGFIGLESGFIALKVDWNQLQKALISPKMAEQSIYQPPKSGLITIKSGLVTLISGLTINKEWISNTGKWINQFQKWIHHHD